MKVSPQENTSKGVVLWADYLDYYFTVEWREWREWRVGQEFFLN